MSVEIIKPMASAYMIVNERLWLTEDGRLVPEGHPDSAFLFCVPGQQVFRADYERYQKASALEEEKASAPEENKAVRTSNNKVRKKDKR